MFIIVLEAHTQTSSPEIRVVNLFFTLGEREENWVAFIWLPSRSGISTLYLNFPICPHIVISSLLVSGEWTVFLPSQGRKRPQHLCSRPHYFSYEIPRLPPNWSTVFIECLSCPFSLIAFQDNQPPHCFFFSIFNIKKTHWVAEMPQWLRASTTLAEVLSLVPSTLVRQTSVTKALKDPMLWVPTVTCTNMYIPTHKHI